MKDIQKVLIKSVIIKGLSIKDILRTNYVYKQTDGQGKSGILPPPTSFAGGITKC
jgi:hypothetical protein